MTLFCVNIPYEVTIRIWDIMLIEGPKTLYRIALAIFKMGEKEMLKAELGDLFKIVK
jgi:hypothetical protein